jgi:phage recombination protein Bet
MANSVSLMGYAPEQIKTIKNTVAADTNALEFDLFIEACKSYGLDPFRKQIHAVVYNKDKPQKRKMTIIVARDGNRVIAQRCGDYRPASSPTVYEYDRELCGPLNPKGIVSATVTLFKQDKGGEWHPVVGQVDWDEFAPIKEQWGENANGKWAPTGEMALDQSGQWAKMPKVMISKCAEMQALRAGWPEQFGGIYSEEEMDRFAEDVTATQAIEKYDQQQREKLVGGAGLMMVFDDTARLEKVPMGAVADRCIGFLEESTPEEAYTFGIRNTESLREFWAHDKSAAFAVKKHLEAKSAQFNPASQLAAE